MNEPGKTTHVYPDEMYVCWSDHCGDTKPNETPHLIAVSQKDVAAGKFTGSNVAAYKLDRVVRLKSTTAIQEIPVW